MAEEAAIEKHVRTFVSAKTGEMVYLDISKERTVCIKHVSKRGSTALAILWINVLQHPNNYPLKRFPYRKMYKRASKGDDRVILQVDGMKVSVFMASGTLTICGQFAIEWFVDRFPGIMDAYGSPIENPRALKSLYTESQKEALALEKQAIIKKYRQNWPDEALLDGVSVVDFCGKPEGEDMPSAKETHFCFTSDDHGYIKPDPQLLPTDALSDQLQRLKVGASLEGPVLYRLWRSILNSWFSDEDNLIYIVTPNMDSDRLVDICSLFLNNRLTANIGAICLPISRGNTNVADVKRDAILQFEPKDQVMVEYKIYSNIVYPERPYQANFIACVRNGNVGMLLTTSDFHGDHFKEGNTSMAVYQSLEESDFMIRYLGPILSAETEQ
ncbi:uncharacterized protein LOC121372152 [Gigantopelta aegis]|uniref:uncharacterized protein LOC121372152 n=1 Tax=Gigantopelta aegis TaxID=1735272 RepID=UPI001B88818C|nr:uncharacterized protein LOC121372152 [Gigantopelta aegis]XP_041354359.1 uncharacterized protein LOC121372152 [Gigantopelta aegis]